MWDNGSVEVFHETIYYEVKVHNRKTANGINGGKIVKLHAGIRDKAIMAYDGKWLLSPEDSPYPGLASAALKEILERYK